MSKWSWLWRRLPWRRPRVAPPPAVVPAAVVPPAVEPVPEPPSAEPSADQSGTPALYSEIALAVLAVTDQMTSAALKRRLAEAVRPLPTIDLIMPDTGDPFDPDRHDAVDTLPAPSIDAVDTVAETISAGLVDHTGTLRRPARVAVYVDNQRS